MRKMKGEKMIVDLPFPQRPPTGLCDQLWELGRDTHVLARTADTHRKDGRSAAPGTRRSTPRGKAEVRNGDHSRCRRGSRARGLLTCGWWGHRPVQPLWQAEASVKNKNQNPTYSYHRTQPGQLGRLSQRIADLRTQRPAQGASRGLVHGSGNAQTSSVRPS